MRKKQYVLAVGESESSNIHPIFFTRTRMIVFFSCFTVLFLSMAYLIGHGIQKFKTNYQVLELKKENAVLKNSYALLEERAKKMESNLNDLQKRNRQIRVAAAMPVPEIEYGVGGPDTPDKSGLDDYTMINQADLDLTKLEVEIEWLHNSTTELEKMTSTKVKQIAHFPSIRPVRGGWISSKFGDRIDPFTGKSEDHPGLDISIRPESEVCAPAAGVVKVVNNRVITNKGYGKYIIIDHGYGYETLYGHMSKTYVKAGQRVKRWDILGLTGNTGKSTAPHIHYGVLARGKPRNPKDFILE